MEAVLFNLFILLLGSATVVILIVYVSKVNALTSRLRWLEQEIFRLRDLLQPARQKEASAAPSAPPAVHQQPAQASQPTPPAQAATQVQAALQVPSVPPPMFVPQSPSRAREEWESFVGGKLLNRVGAIALIIGVGFFLKYAFDNNWISESMRVMLGGIAGVALLLLGARFHRKEFQVFAQGLIGAGISILYLSVFASFNFYNLVSQTGAFILMSLVTVIAFYHAFTYDSLAISILGWAGGYLTPFMLSTGVSNEIGLFTYIDILEAGLLAIVIIRQSWRILALLTFLGTYGTFALWHARYYSEDAFLPTLLFLTLFWLLFYAVDLYRIWTKQQLHPIREFVNILNSIVYYAYLYALVDAQHHAAMGLLTLVLAALYSVPALLLVRTTTDRSTLTEYVITTVVLVIFATAIQYSGLITVTLWACEAVLLIWCARTWNVPHLLAAAMVFFPVIIIKLFSTDGALAYVPTESFSLFFNKRFFTFLFVSCAMGAGAYLLRGEDRANQKNFSIVLGMAAIVLFLILLSAEIRDVFELRMFRLRQDESGAALSVDTRAMENLKQLSLSALWLCYGIVLMIGGIWRRTRGVRILAICILGMSIMKIFIYDLSSLQTLYRIFSFIGLGLILLAASYMYQKYKTLIFGNESRQ